MRKKTFLKGISSEVKESDGRPSGSFLHYRFRLFKCLDERTDCVNAHGTKRPRAGHQCAPPPTQVAGVSSVGGARGSEGGGKRRPRRWRRLGDAHLSGFWLEVHRFTVHLPAAVGLLNPWLSVEDEAEVDALTDDRLEGKRHFTSRPGQRVTLRASRTHFLHQAFEKSRSTLDSSKLLLRHPEGFTQI